jgi:integrase
MACVRKRRGKYVLDYYDQHGQRRWETTKGNKREADRLLRQRQEEVERGTYQARSDQTTFEELAEAYIARAKTKVRDITAAEYEDTIRRHILPFFTGRRLRTITLRDVELFAEHLSAVGVAGLPIRGQEHKSRKFGVRTVNKCLVLVSMMFGYAVRHGWMPANPAGKVEKAKGPAVTEDHVELCILDAAEIQRLLDAATDEWRLIIRTAIYTGLRESELFGLAWRDVELDAGYLYVQRCMRQGRPYAPKSKASRRRVPIPRSLVADLRKWKLACPKGDHDLVFPNGEGKPLNPSNLLNRGFKPALRRAGLREIRFHDLRHTYASHLIANREDPKTIQTLMGHSSIKITFDTYGHMFKASTQGVADRLDHSLGSKVVAEPLERVVGASYNPVIHQGNAGVAQLVEQLIRNPEPAEPKKTQDDESKP